MSVSDTAPEVSIPTGSLGPANYSRNPMLASGHGKVPRSAGSAVLGEGSPLHIEGQLTLQQAATGSASTTVRERSSSPSSRLDRSSIGPPHVAVARSRLRFTQETTTSSTAVPSANSSVSSARPCVTEPEKSERQFVHEMAARVSQMDLKPRYDPETELQKSGKREVWRQKVLFGGFLLSVK